MQLTTDARPDRRHHRRLDWTDLAILVGPNMRWVEDDYPTLVREYPEVLLGYQVRFSTYAWFAQEVRGRHVGKVVVLRSEIRMPSGFWSELYKLKAMGAKIEWWTVHGDRAWP